eukprot:NODE_8693_length_655_cov_746.419173_g8068_i0.p1 GENE.NODE_8693_length_655_cov_746.419173_g8068_i0~~NODE_8693_length_655_cov_746.419173_g8068_i0.p1  ORF type:complete len:137 (-),score=13.71 NODE_8693_length_655_cov_746.419173_g8068_i0:175-585(-)
MSFLWSGILSHGITDFATRVVLVYFGYKSYKAIETDTLGDDAQWLTFWLLYSVILFISFWLELLQVPIPYLNEFKLGLIIYMAWGGSTQVYNLIGKKMLVYAEQGIEIVSRKAQENDKFKELSQKGKVAWEKKFAK